MNITQIFILAFISILLGQLKRGRSLAYLAVSAFVIYWLQPVQTPANLTYWFPTFTLLIVIFSWWFTFSSREQTWRQNLPALLVLAGIALLMGMNRYFQLEQVFITETPRMLWVGITVAMILSPTLPVMRIRENRPRRYLPLSLVLIGLLVITRLPFAMTGLYETMLSLRGRELPGSQTAFLWLGFSYVVFRLLHTIFDRIAGRLAPMPLAEFINYVIFFPTFLAGPLDRFERFVGDLHAPVPLDRQGWLEGGERFFIGLFKKFVLADGLAWVALNQTFVNDIKSPAWLWVFLYAFSLQIYFDFSGYTDMAIGLGRFLGIRLPENFNSPYLKPNLTLFWNSWHMTLTQWFRSYYFNPVTRSLRSSEWKLPSYLVILISQTTTMILIGLWHGITINFLFWGLWHGVGLYVQNRWSNFMRGHFPAEKMPGGAQQALKYLNPFLTFNFVSLGRLFFMLPTPSQTWLAFQKLFGVAL
jgi:D-alanyl-lipoteichoic acid acyltransferase DltB (MBOAT superfamily)